MLILPLDRRLDWRHPPLVTLALVVINVLVFLLVQWNDDREVVEANRYYLSSGLAKLEVPAFKDYLRSHGSAQERAMAREAADDQPGWMWLVQTDLGFQQRLHSGQVISPASDDYPQWRAKRRQFEQRYEDISFVHHGLRTAQPTLATLLSHQFLHGGIWHLLGNMVFLLAVGLLVEITLKPGLLLACYLIGGLGSAAFNLLFDPPSLIPNVGASGAISGLMGMYTVLYGLRRIRFFYSIGIYFDYVRLPAIVLLPAWIGDQILQIWLYPESNINYMAHLGGMVSGAVLGLAVKHFSGGFSMQRIEQEDADRAFDEELAAARRLCDAFEYRKALPVLRRLYQRHPDHAALLQLYHEAARIDPGGDDYHEAVNRLLQRQPERVNGASATLALYREYLNEARPRARLKSTTLLALVPALLQAGALDEAERIVTLLAKRPKRDARLATLAEQLASALHTAGEAQKSEHYRRLAAAWSTTSA